MYIGPKVYEGVYGYQVITPLIRSGDQAPILVNRGFVAEGQLRYLDFSKYSDITIQGLLRRAPSEYWSTPTNRPDENKWYWLDVKAIMNHLGHYCDGEQFRDVYLEEIFQGDSGDVKTKLNQGIPIGRPPTVDFRNTHATYAFIW